MIIHAMGYNSAVKRLGLTAQIKQEKLNLIRKDCLRIIFKNSCNIEHSWNPVLEVSSIFSLFFFN